MRKPFIQGILLLLGSTALLAVVILAGWLAFDRLRGQAHAYVPFAEIDCPAPPGMNRVDFLDEVQYVSSLPGKIHIFETDLAQRLTEAFARHPWVEHVDRVYVIPPRRLAVELTFRQPVLAVAWNGKTHAVDGHGIRLPNNVPTAHLPMFPGQAAAPKGPPGTEWGDPAVLSQAQKHMQVTHIKPAPNN